MHTIKLLLFVVPLVISSRVDPDLSPFDSVPSEPKSRFAMLDDVKILANGLLQLGHGLKDFVHKTKGQINDIFQKLNIFDQCFYDLSLQTNEIKEEEKELRRTTSKLQVKNEEVKNMSLELNSKLESLLEEKMALQHRVRALEEQLTSLVQNPPGAREHPEVTSLKSFVEQQDNSIRELLQSVEEQYKQLSQQHIQIKEIENQLRKTGIQEPTENSLYSKPRAPRTTPPLHLKEAKNIEQDDLPADCSAIYNRGEHTSGVYTIRPSSSQVFNVYCDTQSGTPRTLIQHRKDGSQNFNQTWENYEKGFGRLDGEFWLGLEKIYAIVKQSNYILRLELQDWKDSKHYAEYSFHLGNHETNYTLHVAEIAANIPEALPEHRDLMFSTWDHRAKGQLYCPESYSGGWWFSDMCGENNLNGKYNKPRAKSKPERRRGISWRPRGGKLYSIKSSKMMLQPTT
ncbi:angiopoietin-like 3, isoform CRA_b [Rattus norvegicus]|uniref:Angiopoietin-related protein 3 n=2 Tax=Rattus norvegicus TaxID=10116 RepID=F7FHP0_RAT|nr:angiopoietin-related protein 3 isoform 1 precursor [Rattus norvegicus]EDL97807.1 angiopoietin-like 3, isoform CRA_b [Rattus norvegicus]|eukprot:XP_006238502.1 PREDICTED: angiopoietin-related protein 3 isoform X1 [Rattus norvegicus]